MIHVAEPVAQAAFMTSAWVSAQEGDAEALNLNCL